jgi:hypothetical protein
VGRLVRARSGYRSVVLWTNGTRLRTSGICPAPRKPHIVSAAAGRSELGLGNFDQRRLPYPLRIACEVN